MLNELYHGTIKRLGSVLAACGRDCTPLPCLPHSGAAHRSAHSTGHDCDRRHVSVATPAMVLIMAAITFAAPVVRAQPVQDSIANSIDPLLGDRARLSDLSAQARHQQDQFERNHRSGLRFYNGGADAYCEVKLGDLCYWNNNGDVPAPDERTDAKIERLDLLRTLGQAQSADPKDDWASGMRVRYAIEAGLPDTARVAAALCAGTAWWCSALTGLAAHTSNQYVDAAHAFDRALTEMPATQRCEWEDLSWWLDLSMHTDYLALSCANREAENKKIFKLAQPLWLLPANDLANELFARRTISRVHSLGRIPYDIGFSRYILESQVRYGWPTAWSIQNGGVADPRPPSVIGHEPTPSYDFMPVPKAIANPVGATNTDWELKRKNARMRYSPRYAAGFGALPYQFARFRRGDSTVIAGGYRMVRELEMGRAPYVAALTADAFNGTPVKQVRKDSAAAAGALLLNIGNTPMLASLEVFAPIGKRAARVRETVQPLPAGAKISDYLVLVRGDQSATPSLEKSAENAYGSLDIEAGTSVGLYWEVYRPVSLESPLSVSVRATRIGASFFQKLGSTIGLSKAVTPVSIRFADNGRPDGGFGRSLTINFPPVSDGEYQLTLVVSGAGSTDSTTQRIRVKNGK